MLFNIHKILCLSLTVFKFIFLSLIQDGIKCGMAASYFGSVELKYLILLKT